MSDNVKIKVPPNSKESEMMVLGCMLTSVNALNAAADMLDEGDFYYNEHKLIFQALKTAYTNEKPADIHLICEELKRIDKLSAVGGVSYVTSLAQYAGTSAYIEEYAELVQSKSILRKMVYAAQEIEKTALTEPDDVHDALDNAQAKFYAISQDVNAGFSILIKDLLSGVKSSSKIPYLKELQERQENFLQKGPTDPGITGIPTHFIDLDKIIDGLAPSNLIILAARPAMGKSALATNIAENVCFKNNLPVGIFSLEMSAEQLLHRIICSQAEVEADKIRTGSLNGVEFQRIVASVNMMQKHTMIIDDQPGLKITDLRSRARRMKESFGISLLIVDYLQLLSGSGYSKSAENRQNEISEISRMLKNLARELNVPLICLSQLSRKVEERQGHRPMMSDLRESGCLTGDALIKDAFSGKLYTIQELAERKEQTPIFVHAVDHRLKIGPHKMVKAFYSGKKTIYELKTKTGRFIKASANHPFLKMEGWTSLDKLKKGDRIGVPQNRMTTNPTFEDPEFFFEQNSFPTEARSPKDLMGQMSFPVVIPMESSFSVHLFRTGVSTRKQRFVPTFHKARALRLGQEDVHWDEIESIIELKEVDVYDATVEGVHNFVANDIVVHNSIEQDADIVMFLLRREYYDPYDKPGTAELIIAKNRHGGVGNVNLTFRKEVAQFANFTPMYKQDKDENDAFSAFSPNA